jgi:hypothetical protein
MTVRTVQCGLLLFRTFIKKFALFHRFSLLPWSLSIIPQDSACREMP